MVFSRLKQTRGERGQAILLAVVGLVVLAFGMYTTYNLARSVYEKIQLQNAADATAYSLATEEARTFNFIAFSNRAQVAAYVQMMEAQSLLSNLTYVEAAAGQLGDVLQSYGRFLRKTGVGIGDIFLQAGEALEATHASAKSATDAMEEWTPTYIGLKSSKNEALFAVSSMLAIATAMQLADGGTSIARANDPDAELSAAAYVINGLNVASYLAAFDWGAVLPEGAGGDKDAKTQARRIMAELANAAREGAQSKSFIVDRPRHAAIANILSDALAQVGLAKLPHRLSFLEDTATAGFVGTAKLLSDAGGLPALSETAKAEPDHSALSQGGALVAKDLDVLLTLFSGWEEVASVVSTANDGRHCRYQKPPAAIYGSASPGHLVSVLKPPAPRCHSGHRWKDLLGVAGGITPYLKFAPQQSGISAERQSFGQPDVWVLLQKPSQRMQMASGREELHTTVKQGGGEAHFDARIGGGGLFGSGLGDGIFALARAQAYYHRPGAWQEPPNFFNPYWGARLAPKGAAIKRLLGAVGVAGVAAQLAADNIWMH